MRWLQKDPNRWKTKFAFCPKVIDKYWVWLERYEHRLVKTFWTGLDWQRFYEDRVIEK